MKRGKCLKWIALAIGVALFALLDAGMLPRAKSTDSSDRADGVKRGETGRTGKDDVYSRILKDADSFAKGFNDFLDRYLVEVRGMFGGSDVASHLEPEGGDFYMLTTRECNSKYEVVHTDGKTFFSYRAECFRYTGGAHGGTIVKVGTIDVKTGRKLSVSDVIPEDKRAEALERVRKAVVDKIGGEKNLMPTANEVLATLSENFCIGKDGLHFVFAEYSVAPYHYAPELYGPVEVVIPAYATDEDMARLKREFEAEWLKHVAGYTNYTTFGMAQDYADMDKFVKEWKPRILRNQANKVKDERLREKMMGRMLKANSVESLYYGLLVPHQEIWDRWSVYDENVNARGKMGDQEVSFANGRARWMSKEFEGCEMSAVIMEDCVWPISGNDGFAFILVDISANFDGPGEVCSNSLTEYWLGRFHGGKLTQATKLPVKDVKWMPCLENAPFGRAYTVKFDGDRAKVVNCVTGKVVLSVLASCDS